MGTQPSRLARLYRRARCRVGLHNWFYTEHWDYDPPVEHRRCMWCAKQGKEILL